MLTLYAVPVSLYCAKVRIALRHKRLVWNEVPPPGGYGSDEYKQIVPSGNLPALEDGGVLIGDSEAIAEYLEERYPDPPMLPETAADRARVRELSRFHDTRLEPEVRALFAHIDPAGRDRSVVVARSRGISARLAQLARLLEHRRTPSLTLGDCGFPVTFSWIEELDSPLELGIAWPEAVRAYFRDVLRAEAVHEEMRVYRPRLRDWIAGEANP